MLGRKKRDGSMVAGSELYVFMIRATPFRLVFRVLLLLVGATILDRLVVSRLPGVTSQQGHMLLVMVMVIVGWLYVRPTFRDLVRPFARGQGPAKSQSVPSANSSATESAPDASKAIAAVGLFTFVVWITVPFLAEVNLHDEGSLVASVRVAVMVTGVIATFAILLMPIVGLAEKRMGVAFSNRAVLAVLLIAAVGWWIAPAIVILISLGEFSAGRYLDTIFPVTYTFLPVGALALRDYRGR